VNETMATLVGNVASDVRTTTSQAGVPISSFRVASTTRRYDRGRGGWADVDTLYVTVVCWRSLAEHVASSLSKGDPVVVHGRVRMRQWTGDDGRSGTAVELEASTAGHDLSRGVSLFTKARPRDAERPGRSEADELAERVAREAVEDEPSTAVDVPSSAPGAAPDPAAPTSRTARTATPGRASGAAA
jgi:single-strand DNA-binding protein